MHNDFGLKIVIFVVGSHNISIYGFQMPGVCTDMDQIASTSVIVWTTENVAGHVLVAVIQLL